MPAALRGSLVEQLTEELGVDRHADDRSSAQHLAGSRGEPIDARGDDCLDGVREVERAAGRACGGGEVAKEQGIAAASSHDCSSDVRGEWCVVSVGVDEDLGVDRSERTRCTIVVDSSESGRGHRLDPPTR